MSDKPFQTNPQLTAIAREYTNPGFHYIADGAMFRTNDELEQSEYSYTVHDLAQNFTIPDTEVGRKGELGEVDFKSKLEPSWCRDYGLKGTVARKDSKQAAAVRKSPVRYLSGVTQRTTNLVRLAREKRVAGIVFNSANYKAELMTTLSGNAKLSDPSSDPIGLINDAKHSTLVYNANVMIIGEAAWLALCTHPKIVSAVLGNDGKSGIATIEQVRNLFMLEEVLVGRSSYNKKGKGLEADLDHVWGPHIQLQYRDRTAQTREGITWGATAQFQKLFVRQGYDDDKGAYGADIVRVVESVDEKIYAKDLGYLIQNAA